MSVIIITIVIIPTSAVDFVLSFLSLERVELESSNLVLTSPVGVTKHVL